MMTKIKLDQQQNLFQEQMSKENEMIPSRCLGKITVNLEFYTSLIYCPKVQANKIPYRHAKTKPLTEIKMSPP